MNASCSQRYLGPDHIVRAHSGWLVRLIAMIATTTWIVACAPALEVKPIALSSDPTAQIKSLKEALDTARKNEVHLFSPTWFARADASSSEAAGLRERGGDIQTMLTAVARGRAELEQANRFAGIARTELAESYQARKDAIAAGAAELYGRDFGSVEARFRALGEDVENENLSSARNDGKNVVQVYRELELRAIKEHTLGEARRLIDTAIDNGAHRNAPRSLKEAQSSLAATDKFITGNPRATQEIQARASDTLRRASYLNVVLQQVKTWGGISLEDQIRSVDSGLTKIDATLAGDSQDRQVQTLDQHMDDIQQRVRVLVDNQRFLNSELSSLQEQRRREVAETLKRETEYQATIAKSSAEEARAAAALENEKDLAARFARVQQMFSKNEAEVYRQGNDLLIRLKGLNFEVGKAYVLPEHYPLLTKVMQASRIVDAGSMTVEGHTDTSGTAAVNQVLSQERAAVVKAYLVNNGGFSAELINAIGFGPDKPIAANTTADGRRLNRRTDVILNTR